MFWNLKISWRGSYASSGSRRLSHSRKNRIPRQRIEEVAQEDARVDVPFAELELDGVNPAAGEHLARSPDDLELVALGVDLHQIESIDAFTRTERIHRRERARHLTRLGAPEEPGHHLPIQACVARGALVGVDEQAPAPLRRGHPALDAGDAGRGQIARQQPERLRVRFESVYACVGKRAPHKPGIAADVGPDIEDDGMPASQQGGQYDP